MGEVAEERCWGGGGELGACPFEMALVAPVRDGRGLERAASRSVALLLTEARQKERTPSTLWLKRHLSPSTLPASLIAQPAFTLALQG